MERFAIMYKNKENLFEVNQNFAENKKLMTQYFKTVETPTPQGIKGKSKNEINNIANASKKGITEKEVKVLLVLIQYELCELLTNDNPLGYPKYFQDLCNKICDDVTFLSITDETTCSKIKKKYNRPTFKEIQQQRQAMQQKILNKWLPQCYGNSEYIAIVSN